jgi:hypothetical protein
MAVRAFRVGAVFVAMLAPLAASAGQRPFIWAYDTNIVSTGNVELEQWLWIEGPVHTMPSTPPDYWIWWGPVVGITQHIEVAVPFQVHASGPSTSLASFDADFRYRLFPQDDRDGFQALLRAAWHQTIYNSPSRVDFNLSASYGSASELHLVTEVGGQIPATNVGTQPIMCTWDVGAAYPVVRSLPALQLGAEAYGEVFFNWQGANANPPNQWLGATVAWSGGRYWATLGVLVALTQMTQTPEYLTRLVWAVAL